MFDAILRLIFFCKKTSKNKNKKICKVEKDEMDTKRHLEWDMGGLGFRERTQNAPNAATRKAAKFWNAF